MADNSQTTKFEQLCAEIDRDFSLLSETARTRLKLMLEAMAYDAFMRGREIGVGDQDE